MRNALRLEHAANGEDRREQSGDEQTDGDGEQDKDAEAASVGVRDGNSLDGLWVGRFGNDLTSENTFQATLKRIG